MLEILNQTFLGSTVLQYLYFLGTIILVEVIALSIGATIFRRAKILAKRTRSQIDDIVLATLDKVVGLLGLLLGFYIGKDFLNAESVLSLNFGTILTLAGTLVLALIIQNLTDSILDEYLHEGKIQKKNFFTRLLPVVRRLSRVIIWVIALALIVSNLGFDVTSLLAGLGLGGLAFALAAQSTLANLFASVAIFSDRPFDVGDFIKAGDIMGTVKEVGLRSTRLLSIGQTIITIPNSELADRVIENYTKREAVESHFYIGVVYDTSNAKLKKAIQIIMDILKKEKQMKAGYRAKFASFGDFSLNIEVRYWLEPQADYADALEIMSQINLSIKEQFEKAKISFAFPTQTIELKK